MPPGEDGPWERAGNLLIQRRIDMDPRYRNRRLFAEERGLNWRLLHDIERAKRTNFEPETLAAVESAYRLVPGSYGRMLEGGGLEPLPDAAAAAGPLDRAGASGPDPDRPGSEVFPDSPADARTWDALAQDGHPPDERLMILRRIWRAEESAESARWAVPGAGLQA